MTIGVALTLTYRYLRAFGLVDWRVRFTPAFTESSMMDLVGFCDVTVKTIWLTKRAIDDDAEALRVIRHEVAHCLQPPEQFYDEDAAHGKDFEAALAKVHNLTLPQCIGEGPRGEKLYAAA